MANQITMKRYDRKWQHAILGGLGKGALLRAPFFGYSLHKLHIGRDANINGGLLADARGGILIGDHVFMGRNVWLLSGGYDYPERGKKPVCRPIEIKDYAQIGAEAIIMPGVSIGRNASVASGSVVVSDVADFEAVSGVPATRLVFEDEMDEITIDDVNRRIYNEPHYFVIAGRVFLELRNADDGRNHFFIRDKDEHCWNEYSLSYPPYLTGFENIREVDYDEENEKIISSWRAIFPRRYFYWRQFKMLTALLKYGGVFWHEWDEKDREWVPGPGFRWEDRYYDAGYGYAEVDFDEETGRISNPRTENGVPITDDDLAAGYYPWVREAMEKVW